MNKCLIAFLLILTISCNNEEPGEDTAVEFFPVNSYLNSQVAHVDTSLYKIIQVVSSEGRSDTSYIPREKFREVAKDFLSIPDITSKKLKKHYEESQIVEEESNTVVLNYLPKKQDLELKRLDVTIIPTPSSSGDQVSSIFIDHWKEAGDSTILKKMTWTVGKKFLVTKIIQTPNQKERIVRTEVIWNDHPADDQVEQ